MSFTLNCHHEQKKSIAIHIECLFLLVVYIFHTTRSVLCVYTVLRRRLDILAQQRSVNIATTGNYYYQTKPVT